MKVWLDLSNSPHPLLFAPVSRRLEELGHEIVATVRDNAQTAQLSLERWPDAEIIGEESPKGRVAKTATIAGRALALMKWARKHRPDVALSHNSDSQIAAGRLMGVRVVTAMDYEHHPANHLSFRFAHSILLPEALPLELVRRQGARASKVIHYPGLKEEIYLGDFEPDPDILKKLGIERSPGSVVFVTRTPPARAIYHRTENSSYPRLLKSALSRPEVSGVALCRHPEQHAELAALGFPNLIVPDKAIDARSLMYAADAVIGAGGTMTREAALLGIPTFSVFAGKPAAVDSWLEQHGRLGRVTDPGQVGKLLQPRATEPTALASLSEQADTLIEYFVRAVCA